MKNKLTFIGYDQIMKNRPIEGDKGHRHYHVRSGMEIGLRHCSRYSPYAERFYMTGGVVITGDLNTSGVINRDLIDRSALRPIKVPKGYSPTILRRALARMWYKLRQEQRRVTAVSHLQREIDSHGYEWSQPIMDELSNIAGGKVYCDMTLEDIARINERIEEIKKEEA